MRQFLQGVLQSRTIQPESSEFVWFFYVGLHVFACRPVIVVVNLAFELLFPLLLSLYRIKSRLILRIDELSFLLPQSLHTLGNLTVLFIDFLTVQGFLHLVEIIFMMLRVEIESSEIIDNGRNVEQFQLCNRLLVGFFKVCQASFQMMCENPSTEWFLHTRFLKIIEQLYSASVMRRTCACHDNMIKLLKLIKLTQMVEAT